MYSGRTKYTVWNKTMAGSLGVLFAVVGHVRLRLILIGYLDRRKRDVCFRSAWQVLGGFIWSLCLAGICFKTIDRWYQTGKCWLTLSLYLLSAQKLAISGRLRAILRNYWDSVLFPFLFIRFILYRVFVYEVTVILWVGCCVGFCVVSGGPTVPTCDIVLIVIGADL